MKGRPLKGNTIRKPTTVYMATDTTSQIDEVVKHIKQNLKDYTQMSRLKKYIIMIVADKQKLKLWHFWGLECLN